MKELVFLVEGQAEKDFLGAFLPRILPGELHHRVIPFEGKQDLEARMTQKIRGYQNPEARFVVVRDLDSHPDCVAVKKSLLERCLASGRAAHCLVRIACKELESFYLADLQAVETALGIPGLSRHQLNQKFRDPDRLGSPSRELQQLTKNRYQKRQGSRAIGAHLDPANERSASFRNLVTGIRRLSEELLAA
ncbi:DUF4276 family protein [Silanimonas sp.]|jgi:hypothetical protein|uniref:DUF4276 family protein n=1 Tax=Silanimonas sp. TaxID=1929290 RepID=UPI0037CAC645